MPVAPLTDVPSVITLTAGGCGIGFHRGPWGGCRPNGGYYAYGYRPYAYGYRPYAYRADSILLCSGCLAALARGGLTKPKEGHRLRRLAGGSGRVGEWPPAAGAPVLGCRHHSLGDLSDRRSAASERGLNCGV
jgi:hypothetical protein